MICRIVSVLAPILTFLVIYCNGAAVTISTTHDQEKNLIPEDADYTTTEISDLGFQEDGEDRVDIIYNSTQFKEIDQDILQIIGNPSTVSLSCHYNKNKSSFVGWNFHGNVEDDFDGLSSRQNDVTLHLYSIPPPVCRMECVLRSNTTIRNNTLVYKGDGKPPYLHNHGKSVRATVLNETTANLPCILNYHIENLSEPMELQLFKDGNMVENKNNCLSYTPENGYFLNLTLLENPLGKYECRVINSTNDDIVTVNLTIDNYIHVNYTGHITSFYENQPVPRQFQCTLPKNMFEKKFRWYFLFKNGSIEYINDTKANETEGSTDPIYHVQKLKVIFPTADITHIGCYGFVKDSTIRYNNSYHIPIKTPTKPEILNGSSDEIKKVEYSKGKNVTCAAYADPVTWTWLKDGSPIQDWDLDTDYVLPHVKRSTLKLNPSADDRDVKITCVASNYLGNASYSFRVALPEPVPPPSKLWLVVLLSCLAFIILIVGIMLIFFKWTVTRRELGKQHILNFFNGDNLSYDQLEESLEPYATISYDHNREIKKNSLIFERSIKSGNFGQVEFGRLLDTINHSSRPVAIKSVKDNPRKSKKEMEDAFVNFLKEIKLMQFVGFHTNVVGYIGAVTSDIAKYSAYLVLEYCCGGDLATYLTKNRGTFHDDIHGVHSQAGVTIYGNSTVLKTSHLLKWAGDIAAGLEYISSKRIVHMDLAARNVLLAYPGINSDDQYSGDPAKMIAKISDFGISRNLNELNSDFYTIMFDRERPENNKPRELPLRWMAIEALESLRFTTQSDVWSLGVMYWEMFILGDLPFKEVTGDDTTLRYNLISHIKNGNVLSEPALVHRETWDIMLQCWDENPQNRPTPTDIKNFLHNLNEVENERLQRELQNEDPEEPPNQSCPPTAYCQVGIMDTFNIANNGDSTNEYYGEEYSDYEEESDADGEINEAQSNV